MRAYLLAAALAAGGLIAACTVNSTTNNNGTNPAGDDAGNTPAPDSGLPDGAVAVEDAAVDAEDAAAPEAFVRFAHWSPDAPAVDICFNPAGGAWAAQTPALGQIVAAPDAGAAADAGDAGDDGGSGVTGVTFRQVTSYLVIAPGTYGVRLVAAGATDCGTGIVDLASVTLNANTYTTVAALGEATPVGTDQALKLASFADDVTAPASQIALRFINASPNASLAPADFGDGSLVGNGGPFSALFTGVAFGAAGTSAGTDAGTVDANGYLATLPLAGATLSAHATSGAQDTTTALDDVTISGGAATIALIDGVSNGSAASAAKLLLCADADDSASTSLFAQCSIVSTE
jgi:hypothetical protein